MRWTAEFWAPAVSNADVTMPNQLKHPLLVIVFAVLGGCVYLPNTTTIYNQKCQTYQRRMTLEVQQVGTLMGCQGDACAGALIAFGAVSAATAIVSGSIVIIGNVVYWLEEQGQCLGSSNQPAQR